MDDKVASQLETLTGLMSSLKSAIGDLNGAIKGLNSSANNMSSAISEAEKSAGSFNKALGGSQSAMKDFADGLNENLENVENFNASMDQKALAATKDIHRRYGAFFSSQEKQQASHQRRFLGSFQDYAKQQYEIYHSLESRRARFFHIADGTFKNMKMLLGFGNSLFKVFKDLAGVVLRTAKFIISLPLKTLETMLDIAHSIREEFLAISQSFEDTQENISGASRQGMGLADLTSEVRGLGGAFLNVGSEAARTFGYALQGQQAMISKTAEKLNGLGTLANLYGTSYTKNAILVERAMQSLGMSVEDNAILVRQSMSEGIHPFHALTRSINASQEASAKFGIDQKQVAKGMNELRKNIIEFSHISEPELAGVVAQAAQLGIEAKELNAVFSKFTTFDQAAESAALLSQTFGMAVDAMDIIRAEDPMEIINQFREGMQQTGRDFRDLNRHEKALLSQYTGLSGEALQTAMSFEGIGLSYEELQKKMEENSPQAQLKDAVKEMSASIKEFMNVGKKLTSPFQAITEGMKDALVKNTSFQRSMMRLSSSMQRLYSGVLSKFVSEGLLETLDNIIDAFANLIDDEAIKGLVKLAQEFGNFLTVILNADSTAPQITRSFNTLADTFFNNPFVSRLSELGQIMIGNIASGFIKALPAILGGFVDLLKMFNGTLQSTDLNNSETGIGGWFQKYIVTAWNQVSGLVAGDGGLMSQLFAELKKALSGSSGFLYEIGEMIVAGMWKGITTVWDNLDWKDLALIAAIGIGPGLAMQLATMGIGKMIAGGIAKSAGAAIAGAASGSAASGLAGIAAAGTGAMVATGAAAVTGVGMIGKDLYDMYDNYSNNREQKGEDIGGVVGGAIGGGLGFLLGGPFGAAAGVALGNAAGDFIGGFFDSDEESNKQAAAKREAQRARESSELRRQMEESNNRLTETVVSRAEQPIVINLAIKQMLDGDELTNRILSAALNGTTQFNINTDGSGQMMILSNIAIDAGGYYPVPLG